MKTFKFWNNWLTVFSIFSFVLGLYIALLNNTILFLPFRMIVDPVFLDGKPPSEAFLLYQGFSYGLTGAVFCTASVFLYFISVHAFKNREKWAWAAVISGITAWFLIDESVSIVFMVYYNAVFNIVYLIAWILPLIFTKKYFKDMDHAKS